MKKIGILSIGTYVPQEVRKNDWWPQSIVERWSDKRGAGKGVMATEASQEKELPNAVKRGIQAMAALRDDPFKGAIERRIHPTGMKPSEMEIAAAQDAIKRAGISPSKIGLILNASEGPDSLFVSSAPTIQKAVGAPGNTIAFGTEAVCNGFMMQLQTAEALIQNGTVEYALLTQSCTLSKNVRPEDSFSPWFGDAATAVIVGACDPARGLLAMTHASEPDYFLGMLLGSTEGPWWDGHKPHLYIADAKVAKEMAMMLPEWALQSISQTLKKAKLDGSDVRFVATHQATPWLRPLVQELIGAPQAKSCDTFGWTASVGPCNVPLCLAMGEREGLLKKDDLVVAWTGGAGTTNSSLALRWGW